MRDRNAELFDKLELARSVSLLSTKLVDSHLTSRATSMSPVVALFETRSEQINFPQFSSLGRKSTLEGTVETLAVVELPTEPIKAVQFCSESITQTNADAVKSERTLHRWVRDSFQVRNNLELFKNDLKVLPYNRQLLGHNIIDQNLAVRNTESNVRSTIKQEKFKVDRLSSKLSSRPVGYTPR